MDVRSMKKLLIFLFMILSLTLVACDKKESGGNKMPASDKVDGDTWKAIFDTLELKTGKVTSQGSYNGQKTEIKFENFFKKTIDK